MPNAKGQERGNSGVYLQGRYEVQILDSYGLQSKNDDCGAIYEVAAPLVNACHIFIRARFCGNEARWKFSAPSMGLRTATSVSKSIRD
jgi:hypothetical protein